MKRIGITGGIGSGKSYVCHLLEQQGYPVYYADARAKALYTENAEVKQQMLATFGREVYTADGSLNRVWLAERVFPNPEELKKLNGIVHPAVALDGERWFAAQEARGMQAAFYEAALLFEINARERFDALVLVTAPEDLRVERVVARDGLSPEEVRHRMARQWPDERKRALADFVIENDGRDLSPQLAQLLAQYGS